MTHAATRAALARIKANHADLFRACPNNADRHYFGALPHLQNSYMASNFNALAVIGTGTGTLTRRLPRWPAAFEEETTL
jgi:hypothetical protein